MFSAFVSFGCDEFDAKMLTLGGLPGPEMRKEDGDEKSMTMVDR